MVTPDEVDLGAPPLHHLLLEAGQWYACEHPERPVEKDATCIDIGCRACVLMLGAASMAAPDRDVVDLATDETVGNYAAMYERLRGQHGLPALPGRAP